MHSLSRIALVAICVSTFAACEQAANSALGPTAIPLASTPAHVEASPTAEFGARTQGVQDSTAHGIVSQSVNDWRTADDRDDDEDRDEDEDDDDRRDESDRVIARDSGFPCALGPFGLADKSFASKSKKGDQILKCTGEV